jgi:hypothetical protein
MNVIANCNHLSARNLVALLMLYRDIDTLAAFVIKEATRRDFLAKLLHSRSNMYLIPLYYRLDICLLHVRDFQSFQQ